MRRPAGSFESGNSELPASAVLVDLLMATMDSISVWVQAAGNRETGLAWRDAVTARMLAAGEYIPYEGLLEQGAATVRIDSGAVSRLRQAWMAMDPWPDVAALDRLTVPYAFVTNCSSELAAIAVARSGLSPAFTLTAEEAGWYKPRPGAYLAACDRFGVTPAVARFVAGAAYDAIGADAAGLRTVLVRRREPDRPLPARIPVVDTLPEAVGAP